MGKGSVYSFFLGNSKLAWLIALVTSAVQIWMLIPFITAGEFNLSQENDLEYTWKCTRSSDECHNTNSITPQGWAMAIVLVIVFVSKDLICGLKMVRLSGKKRHSHSLRVRFFTGGTILCFITTYIIYASVIYNKTIATSNTELIYNGVIILFINEIDEKIFELIDANYAKWIDNVTKRKEQEENGGREERKEEEQEVGQQEGQQEEKEQEKAEEEDPEELVNWQKTLVKQQKQIEELQEMVQLLKELAGLPLETNDPPDSRSEQHNVKRSSSTRGVSLLSPSQSRPSVMQASIGRSKSQGQRLDTGEPQGTLRRGSLPSQPWRSQS